MLVVDEAYLATAYAAAEASYGSLDGYLTQGLGLDDEVLARLRVRLLG